MDNTAEEIAEKLFGTLNDVSDTQKLQTAIIDKLADGLARSIDIIDNMRQHIKSLEKRIETLEKGGKV